MESRKQAIIDALRAFIRQRPGMDPRNSDRAGYLSESRRVTQDRHHAETLLAAVASNDGITADMIVKASESAYSGRLGLSWVAGCDPPQPRIAYCTGQYFPAEYRRAVAAVCASALWYYVREHELPTGENFREALYAPGGTVIRERAWHFRGEWLSAGDWLRAYFRREFGRTIAERYFQ